jgi:hypothetical protein
MHALPETWVFSCGKMETTVFNVVEKRSEGTPKGSGLSSNVR